MSLDLSENARALEIRCLGGDYAQIAARYREVARDRGLIRTLAEKAAAHPSVPMLYGAPEFKLFVLGRTIEGSVYHQPLNGEKERVFVGYTFDEAAAAARYLHNQLGIQRAMVVLAGWIHRGYDNQHPDILPAAPECGGNEALARCSQTVRSLGYLFGLHDNYQDIYRDSPSWSESVIMKNPDGSLVQGGNWAGGQAWLICSREGLKFAERNFLKVKALFAPNTYFTDTTTAAPPLECFDPNHPLTRDDDIEYKRKLIDLCVDLFGSHGSEAGHEWAAAHSTYFEGIVPGAEGAANESFPFGREVPLFEMVYGDCVALYAHQGDRAYTTGADYILRHALLASMPVYADPPKNLYAGATRHMRVTPSIASCESAPPGLIRVTYAWKVEEAPTQAPACFVHFVDSAGAIAFQDDHAVDLGQVKPGDVVSDGPREVKIPEGRKGVFSIRVGFYDDQGRWSLDGLSDGEGRYLVGALEVTDGMAKYRQVANGASALPPEACFARSEGWAQGMDVSAAFIKNTYELLSPLSLQAANVNMTDFRWLDEEGMVRRSQFGPNIEVVANLGNSDWEVDGSVLPSKGLLIRTPTFLGFYAKHCGSIDYPSGGLFTLRSLDGLPLATSGRIRVYHGFGEPIVWVPGKTPPAQVVGGRVIHSLGTGWLVQVEREGEVVRGGGGQQVAAGM